ncbi:hypothetical protein DUZ99_06245 [Xylanibacillus composti]|uniref:Uncharacterized protein n=1 Tax=Xylanibacillus composti TaxID=1572762 RepID=A0A8J4H7Z4_9BACL|nr:hypothetical protein [Xylanibacillus composti]MDT9724592.1 hypothetical protein [Xylanibacillus composti]GIQ70248.1 hypothetical protein XYCOK13_30720 [Xylanibacillus composti]
MTERKSLLEHWTYQGKPLRVLSTSLGVALAANLLLMPPARAETTNPDAGPVLVEWSTEAVKEYYDPEIDWNLPIRLPAEGADFEEGPLDGSGEEAAGGTGGGSAPVIVHNGFGWDDLLLYHLIFNSGRSYSSRSWSDSRPVYNPRTNEPYRPKTFESGSFQNKPTAGSTVRPKTTDSTGSITRRGSASSSSAKATSSSPGGIGGKSSSFSSSSKSSSFGG